ncbi:hypothetical protein [Schlesneria paludicola]|uniref:hypothetical protein n=1 Tax=Schlesneria paludicola TaxID=360056 RepID=UPI000299FE41|nr:hypothetical protein [Schlesneria paludicola]
MIGEYFHGTSRKLGVVTLVLACALMAGWSRSISTLDVVTVPLGATTVVQWASTDRQLLWVIDSSLAPGDAFSFNLWDSDAVMPLNEILKEYRWTWHFYGMGTAEAFTGQESIWVVPYMMVVIPLTLVSLILIVWNPRIPVVRSQQPPEPLSNQIG